MPAREDVERFVALVEGNRFMDALRDFYADDASMQENHEAPRRGLQALLDHEAMVLKAFASVTTRPGSTVVIDEEHVVIRWIFEFVTHQGGGFTMEEIALQRWSGGRIHEERFFYDPAQRAPRSAAA
jgi:ketosteroid isomerase-like protein